MHEESVRVPLNEKVEMGMAVALYDLPDDPGERRETYEI
jgi:hypothetical protein